MKKLLIRCMLLGICACGSSANNTTGNGNTAGNGNTTTATKYSLTVNNQAVWCDVTVQINGTQVASFSTASATIQAAAGTTVQLSATPQPGFQPAVWTGTTSSTNPTTYIMTTDANQTVTAFCST